MDRAAPRGARDRPAISHEEGHSEGLRPRAGPLAPCTEHPASPTLEAMLATPRALPPLLSALTSVALLGCFSDGEGMTSGNASDASNTSAPTSSPTDPTDPTDPTTGTVGETSTSSDPTTETTVDPTTTDPTTEPTTEPTTTDPTTDPTGCQGVCQPGEVELGDECGSCGLTERVCDELCEWGPSACVEHLETCGFWRLPEGATSWERHPLYTGEQPAHAPTEPVLAAFDISARGEAYILTAESYHVLDLQSLAWIRSGTLAAEFPTVAGKPILAAYATPDGEAGNMETGNDSIAIFTPTIVYLFSLKLGTHEVKASGSEPCCEDQWKSPQAPATADIRAFWIALDDADPWGEFSLDNCEGAPPGTILDWYGAAITDSRVHLQNIGTCFDFVAELPFKGWHPFAQSGGPASALEVGAGFLNEGDVWIFRGP